MNSNIAALDLKIPKCLQVYFLYSK
jgi:hypothetical protein